MERYHPSKDFLVLTFQPIDDPNTNVAACYVKKITGVFALWNTVIHNEFYNNICGKDNIDYNA